jgi:hypothetical protein
MTQPSAAAPTIRSSERITSVLEDDLMQKNPPVVFGRDIR